MLSQGGAAGELIKGKHRLLLTRWVHLNTNKKRQLNRLFAPNRRVMKAYRLKQSLDRLWSYTYKGAMLRYLQSWIDQLRWQRLQPMEKLAMMLLNHLEGILNYCQTKVPLGVVEAINGNIKALLLAWSWLPGSRLPAAEGATLGRYQDRIRRLSESRLECTFLQIVVESPKKVQPVIWIPEELTARLPLTTADLWYATRYSRRKLNEVSSRTT
jgi:Transposase